uniref:Nidogen 1 n=1 Tax=Sparus aurata TaxID=8175 RepID=A0A671VDF2_SPAAU
MSPGSWSWLWVWSCLLSLSVWTRALELEELFEFGEEAGDQQLQPGSDSSAGLQLNGSVLFFSDSFDKVYINTNGFVSFAEPPAEVEYLGKMPADFKMIAALLGDLDDSDGQGKVYFRQDDSPEVLSRAAEHIRQAFPRDTGVEPTSTLIVTWENMAAAGTSGRGDGLDAKRNTFQLVVASMESSSYAVLLYPRDGLQFHSTSVGGETKLLETGFNEGLVQGWFWNNQPGTYFRVTTDEETSIRDLTEKTTSGQRGVWVYEIGSAPFFVAITPGVNSDLPDEGNTTEPPATVLPRQPDEVNFTTKETQVVPEQKQEFPTESPTEYPESESMEPEVVEGPGQSGPEYPESETVTPTYTNPERAPPRYPEPSEPRYPVSEPLEPRRTIPETTQPRYSPIEPRYPDPVQPRYTNPEQVQLVPPYSRPHQPQIIIVDEDEGLNVNGESKLLCVKSLSGYLVVLLGFIFLVLRLIGLFSDFSSQYTGTMWSGVQTTGTNVQLSPTAATTATDTAATASLVSTVMGRTVLQKVRKSSELLKLLRLKGLHVHEVTRNTNNSSSYYHFKGKPQRMNGKVNGRVFVGNSPSPVELSNHDLHSYVVANDGRAYVAISNIPDSLGPSLQPLSSLGGVIGWAFALEQPGYQNGFSLIGGEFSRQAEVIFQPGNERLSIKQQFKGIDEHDHLVVSTELEGRLPAVLPGSSVQISPYKEIYQYDRDLITSSSNRDYTITSPGSAVQPRSYQWRQTITFKGCQHDAAIRPELATQQLSVDQIFVMFDADNHLIRYAMSNRIGSVHSALPEQNPCFTGRHGCDINAVCKPGDGLQFTCECSSGFTGDGRYCYDADECSETPQVCGANAVCSNQPGTFRCQCLSGFVFASDGKTCIEEDRPVDHCRRGSHDCDVAERAMCSYTGGSAFVCSCLPGFTGDGRVCRDVDECQQDRCHRDAACSNTLGSYACQCHPGFHGDGFQCNPTEREKTPCERHRESAQSSTSDSSFLSFFRPRPAVGQYVPQCDEHGSYQSTQCHTSIGQCWCVDASGQELPNTRTGPGNTPLCIDQAVTPPPVGPTPRPDVHPVAPGTHLLFAQSGKIEHVPLDGYNIKKEEAKPLLHIPDRVVIAVAYDCVEKMVYWTDITGPAISRARLSGGDISPVITTGLQSPEGIAIDHVARLLFWTDSMRDTVEVSQLDGSQRRVLFDTDLINPRPIVTNSAYGRLYWADWNRDGPKIEMANMDGTERVVLVKDDLGLPNGLTFDTDNQQLCWADAGTRRVECMDPHRRLRRTIVEGIQYPFALVSFGRNLYYTDWRR